MFADHVPFVTATAVRMLEDAGYTNVGKTNLHEFAYGVTSQNPHYGTVPKCGFCEVIPYANSCRFVLPTFA